ncbi:cold-regulated protein 27-like [Rutidosis leptorrhynchoides]|uniref:cold-regulated protein 27-like n=1 Tax=Rutidosis leptorrhynchoides TaxID=125765 RepID=UPI003A992F8C
MNYTIPAPATEAQMCSKMTAADPGLCEFVDQEESSIMESPKRESSEWTDEKHSLYLKSMEASFVDQLYNSVDPRCWQTQNELSSDSMSSRRVHVITRCPSGQFKVLQHGSWSTIDFKRENSVRNETNKTHISKSPWIQHFRNGNGTQNSLQIPESDLRLHCQQTNFSNAEVTDQNFVQEILWYRI